MFQENRIMIEKIRSLELQLTLEERNNNEPNNNNQQQNSNIKKLIYYNELC